MPNSDRQRKKAIRLPSKPSTAKCKIDQYTYFLLSEPKYTGCCRLAEVLGVSRYSTNRFFKEKELNFQVGIAKNRQVKVEGGKYQRVKDLEIPDSGLRVTLKEFGKVKVFKRTFKDGSCRYYASFRYDKSELMDWTRDEFRELQAIHWGIECYHRALKQLCGLSKFQVRTTSAITTHIFCSLRAFCQLEIMRIKATIDSWYSLQRELSLKVAREFILEQLSPSDSLAA